MAYKEAYPLNSKHITIAQVHQIAKALDIPVTGSSSDLLIVIEGKLRDSQRNPRNVQLVVKETQIVFSILSFMMKMAHSLRLAPEHSKVLSPAVDSQSCSSLISSRASSTGDIITETELLEDKPSEPKRSVESVNPEVCTLQQLLEEQQISLSHYKSLLSDSEEKAAELAVKNQQLAELLTSTEDKFPNCLLRM